MQKAKYIHWLCFPLQVPHFHLHSVTPEWMCCPRKTAELAGEAWSKTTTYVSLIWLAEHVDPAMATAADLLTASLDLHGRLLVWHPGVSVVVWLLTHPSMPEPVTSRTGSGHKPEMRSSAKWSIIRIFYHVLFIIMSNACISWDLTSE